MEEREERREELEELKNNETLIKQRGVRRVRRRKRPNIFLISALVLFSFVICTVYLMPGELYAKYKSTDGAQDAARVAEFSVSSVMNGSDTYSFLIDKMLPGDSSSFTINVTNDSEVAVRCTVSVVNHTENIPLEFTISNETRTEYDSLTDQYVPESKTHSYILTVIWNDTSDADNFMSQGTLDKITVSVSVEQIN